MLSNDDVVAIAERLVRSEPRFEQTHMMGPMPPLIRSPGERFLLAAYLHLRLRVPGTSKALVRSMYHPHKVMQEAAARAQAELAPPCGAPLFEGEGLLPYIFSYMQQEAPEVFGCDLGPATPPLHWLLVRFFLVHVRHYAPTRLRPDLCVFGPYRVGETEPMRVLIEQLYYAFSCKNAASLTQCIS